MPNLVDALLRCEGRFATTERTVPWRGLLLTIGALGFVHGAVMGSFDARPLQALYSGIKVPLLLGTATLLCLPSFFVANTLLGLRDDFAAACRGLLATQATMAMVLASLTPATALLYLSTDNYRLVLMANGLTFALAALGGQRTLARHYAPLLARNPRHRAALRSWLLLYVFIAIQLAWMLRPFIGYPGMRTQFLRPGGLDNAYVIVLRALWRLLTEGR